MRWQQIFPPLARLGGTMLDGLLPPLCLRCDTAMTAAGSLCPSCWRQLNFISAPHCPCCGVPYELARHDLPCPTCLATPPLFRQARAAVSYDEASRPLILGFKHADQTQMADALARMMLQAGDALLAESTLVVPVPLHRWRIFRRCYNQSALLAVKIAQARGLPVQLDLLLRQRATPPQAKLSAAARSRNVKQAFAVATAKRQQVVGQKIVLIDDVMTTGATVNDCTRALLAAGAAEVRILTFARTL